MSNWIKALITIFVVVTIGVVAVFVYGGNKQVASVGIIEEESIAPTPTPKPLPEKLKNPPEIINAVYATTWTAATESQINRLIKLANETEVNAIVIDIKDYTGKISFETDSPIIKEVGSDESIIKDIDALVNRLHKNNIYVIARITVFQDPVLAAKHPEWAVKSKKTGKTWKDNKGLAWMDPASKNVWDYIVAVSKEIDKHGFDELNFDYVRFPSDGAMSDMAFPFYDGTKYKSDVIKEFFQYLSANLRSQGIRTSADLFGLATVNNDGLGIGQIIEDAALNFDAVCPMVYPSHYATGFIGLKNPGAHPYEVIKYSLEMAKKKFNALEVLKNSTTSPEEIRNASIAKMRPWLQDFDLGADYTAEMIRSEKQAIIDAGFNDGWLMWDPKNIYTAGALNPQ
jgi:hypothetical protein